MDLAQFAAKMQLRAEKLPENVNLAKQQVAIEVLKNVATQTPVDTARAVSNWIVSLNESPGVDIPPHVAGHKGSTRTENVHATIARGSQIASTSTPSDVIHITNAVHYILELDQGSPTNAAFGMTATGILAGRRLVKSLKLITD